jgi:hypothetical protein
LGAGGEKARRQKKLLIAKVRLLIEENGAMERLGIMQIAHSMGLAIVRVSAPAAMELRFRLAFVWADWTIA